MPRRAGFRPNPVAVAELGDDVLVTLQHANADYSELDVSELVAVTIVEPRVRYRLPLSGFKNCGRAEAFASRAVVAVACSARLDRRGRRARARDVGLVAAGRPGRPAAGCWSNLVRPTLARGQFSRASNSPRSRVVLFKTQTALGSDTDNRLFSLDLDTGATTLLATAARDQSGLGYGHAFGGMSCRAGCGDPCLVADLSRGKLLRFRVQATRSNRSRTS